MGYLVEFIAGDDKEIQAATTRAQKSNSLTTRPICKLYPIEFMHESSYQNFEGDNVMSKKPKKEAAILRDIK